MTDGKDPWKLKLACVWGGELVSVLTSSILQMGLVWHITLTTNSASMLSLAWRPGGRPRAGGWARGGGPRAPPPPPTTTKALSTGGVPGFRPMPGQRQRKTRGGVSTEPPAPLR